MESSSSDDANPKDFVVSDESDAGSGDEEIDEDIAKLLRAIEQPDCSNNEGKLIVISYFLDICVGKINLQYIHTFVYNSSML